MKIKNYRLNAFLITPYNIQENYTKTLLYLEPKPTKKTLWELKYKDVDILRSTGGGDFGAIIETLAKMQGTTPAKVLKMRIIDFFPLLNYLKAQLKQLGIAETKLIPKHGNLKWDIVGGGKRMAKYGVYNTLIPLAAQLNTTIEGVNNMIFEEVFTIQMYNAEISDLQHEMNAIKLPE